MSKLTFEKDIDSITLADCLECQELGIDVIVDEGRIVTFEV